MADDENHSEVTEVDGHGNPPISRPTRKEQSDQVSAWVLTAWMVAAPLLMLITIWLLTVFGSRSGRPEREQARPRINHVSVHAH